MTLSEQAVVSTPAACAAADAAWQSNLLASDQDIFPGTSTAAAGAAAAPNSGDRAAATGLKTPAAGDEQRQHVALTPPTVTPAAAPTPAATAAQQQSQQHSFAMHVAQLVQRVVAGSQRSEASIRVLAQFGKELQTVVTLSSHESAAEGRQNALLGYIEASDYARKQAKCGLEYAHTCISHFGYVAATKLHLFEQPSDEQRRLNMQRTGGQQVAFLRMATV